MQWTSNFEICSVVLQNVCHFFTKRKLHVKLEKVMNLNGQENFHQIHNLSNSKCAIDNSSEVSCPLQILGMSTNWPNKKLNTAFCFLKNCKKYFFKKIAIKLCPIFLRSNPLKYTFGNTLYSENRRFAKMLLAFCYWNV